MAEPRGRRRWADRSLVQLTLVRYREFYREPEAVFWVFIFPVLLTAGLGLAFRGRSADRTPVAVVAGVAGADRLTAALRRADGLAVRVLTDSAAARALRAGDVSLVVTGAPDGVAYRFDPDRPDAREARLRVDEALQRAAGRTDPLPVHDQAMHEPGARYVDFVVPGLLGMNLMGSGIWGIGFAIVDARRKHLLKRLVATPMSRVQFLLSFLCSRLTFLILEVALLVGFAMLVFGVPLRGSLFAFTAVCVLSALSFASLGLLLSARPRTVEGVSGLMNLVMLPMWIFSGVFFSAARFPDAAQPVIRALPLTAVIDALRAVMLRGAGLEAVLPQLGVITAWLLIGFAFAVRLFRWR